jgi:hypothetical protein
VKNPSSFGAKATPFAGAQNTKEKKDVATETPPPKNDSKDKVTVRKVRGRPPNNKKLIGRRKTGTPRKRGKEGKDEKKDEIDLVDDNEGEVKDDSDSSFSE